MDFPYSIHKKMLLFSYFSLIFFGYIINKHSVLFTVFTFVLLFFMTNGVVDRDFISYQEAYDWMKFNEYDDLGYGWFFLCRIGNYLGLTFGQYKVLIQLLSLFIIYKGISSILPYNISTSFFWSCTLVFPLFLDFVQVRFFFAESILCLAFLCLMRNSALGRIVYVFILGLATSIHSSSLFFIVFLLIPYIHKFEKIGIYILAFFSFFLLFSKKIFISFVSLFANNLRIERYFNSIDETGFCGFLAAIIILLFFSIISKRMFENRLDDNPFWNFFYRANQCMWVILPLIRFDPNIFRIQRILWYFLYISVLLFMSSHDNPYLKIEKCIALDLKQTIFCFAFLGNIVYISLFSFDVVVSYLMH